MRKKHLEQLGHVAGHNPYIDGLRFDYSLDPSKSRKTPINSGQLLIVGQLYTWNYHFMETISLQMNVSWQFVSSIAIEKSIQNSRMGMTGLCFDIYLDPKSTGKKHGKRIYIYIYIFLSGVTWQFYWLFKRVCLSIYLSIYLSNIYI